MVEDNLPNHVTLDQPSVCGVLVRAFHVGCSQLLDTHDGDAMDGFAALAAGEFAAFAAGEFATFAAIDVAAADGIELYFFLFFFLSFSFFFFLFFPYPFLFSFFLFFFFYFFKTVLLEILVSPFCFLKSFFSQRCCHKRPNNRK